MSWNATIRGVRLHWTRPRSLLVGALITALPLAVRACDPPPRHHGHDYGAALDAAAQDGRLLLVHLRHPQRDAGGRLDLFTLLDHDVAALIEKRFHQVTVDVLRESKLAERLAGSGTAVATLVLAGDGRVLARQDGYVEATPFRAWLERVLRERPRLMALEQQLVGAPLDVDARLEFAELLHALGADARADLQLAEARSALGAVAPEAMRVARVRARGLDVELLRGRGQDEAAQQLQKLPIERYPPPPSAAEADVERPREPR